MKKSMLFVFGPEDGGFDINYDDGCIIFVYEDDKYISIVAEKEDIAFELDIIVKRRYGNHPGDWMYIIDGQPENEWWPSEAQLIEYLEMKESINIILIN